MADALRLLASGRLSPEVLEVTVQRRPDPKSAGDSDGGWVLRLGGLRASDERIDPRKTPAPARALALSEREFHELAVLLADAQPWAVPQSLYAASYTDLAIEILGYSRTITGRRFLGMTPETHGDKQKAFDRVCEAVAALHERVDRDGIPRPASPE